MPTLHIHWYCTQKENFKGDALKRAMMPDCDGHQLQLLPMTAPPLHVCKSRGGIQCELTIDPETSQSQKQLAIRTKVRYGNPVTENHSEQSANKGRVDMVKRAEPETPAAEAPVADAPAKSKAAKAPAKKAAKPAAAKAPKVPKEVVGTGSGLERDIKRRATLGGRGHLAAQIEKILRQSEAGKLKGVDGPLTVHRIASLIAYEAGGAPSTGAVSAAIDRWEAGGYIKVTGKPKAFDGFTSKWTAAKDGSLDKFLASVKDAKVKAKAKAA